MTAIEVAADAMVAVPGAHWRAFEESDFVSLYGHFPDGRCGASLIREGQDAGAAAEAMAFAWMEGKL